MSLAGFNLLVCHMKILVTCAISLETREFKSLKEAIEFLTISYRNQAYCKVEIIPK